LVPVILFGRMSGNWGSLIGAAAYGSAAIYLLKGSNSARIVLIIFALLSLCLMGFIGFITPFLDFDVFLFFMFIFGVLMAVSAYLLIFSKSLREELALRAAAGKAEA
jgi:hypothetical protein